jgi:hypothetical protein
MLLSLVAAVVLLLGYADLTRGGITLGPILLMLAYGALIPAAIWNRRPRVVTRTGSAAAAEMEYKPSYLAAAIAGAAIFALYLLTLAPSTAMWDTSEYMAAAYTLGLPHPPGNPLFVLLGRVFSVLPIAPAVATRINVLAALSSATAAAMWFLVAERVTAGWFSLRWQRWMAGALAVIIGGTAFTVWNQSVVNEKVYTVSLAGIAIISWLMIRWSDNPDDARSDAILVVVAYLLGLGYANHMAGMLPAPAVGFAVIMRRPRTLVRWRLLLACVGALALGLSPFATQPIRAAFNPPMNEGEPTACRDGLAVDCTLSKGTLDAFAYNFNRGQYGKPELSERQAPFSGQIGMWWLYFRWQWLRDAHDEHQGAQSILAALFLTLGLVGGWVHYRRDRSSFWYFGTLMFLATLGLIYYLNFKYGASQNPGLEAPHEVRDRDYFYLWSFSAWGVWAALGLMYVWESIAMLVGGEAAESTDGRAQLQRRGLLAGAPVLALAFVPLVANWHSASRSGDYSTVAFAHDLLDSVEPYGVLVTAGDNDTFPLWYAQEVEGIRKDVTVAVLSLLNTDWFARGIIRRPVYEYDSAKGPAIYRGRTWPRPTTSPLHLTMQQADSIPQYVVLRDPVQFRRNGIEATIDPRGLTPAGDGSGLLERADVLVLRMIADSWPERPIYISRTAGSYAQKLGLQNYVLSQGLARKVFIPPVVASKDTVFVRGDGWFDIARSHALWTNRFRGPDALLRKGDWVDAPSVSGPLAYVFMGAELAELLSARGDKTPAADVMGTVMKVARVVRQEGLFRDAPAAPSVGDTAR